MGSTLFMMKFKIYMTPFIWLLGIISCNAQTTLSELLFKEGKTTVIKNIVDMGGEELRLPRNITLKFEKGGCLRNGSIEAANTSIVGYKQGIFDGVKIHGEWNVKYISTGMFKDISQLNSLSNLFAFASEQVDNVIVVEDGFYNVAANQNGETILSVPSNTEVIINGTIEMLPNEYTNYYIVGLKGENIRLHGNGAIVGDKHTHKGTKGEWGMGVNLAKCKNVDIYDLTIRDCWGDCIYIGEESADVRINNCTLEHGRRQGISITSAYNVIIENTLITNVGGTAPEYAIDIEPNKNEIVDTVIINNVKSVNCNGGILAGSGAANSSTKNIYISDCYVGKFEKRSYCFSNTDVVMLINSTSDKGNEPSFYNCKSVSVR